jgi:site-specific recombinase XerD
MEHTKGYSNHTIEQYAGHLARFIDFTVEACKHQAPDNEIFHLVSLYHSFLLHGKNSENQVVIELAAALGKEKSTSPHSISRGIEASIVSFFNLQSANSYTFTDDDVLLKYFMSQSSQSEREITKAKGKSWLAGCIKGSLERTYYDKRQTKIFPKSGLKHAKKKQAIDNWNKRAFKLENINALVNYKPSRISPTFHRDMAIYMLLGATGGRSHECLQLRVDDFDLEERQIRLVDPFEQHIPGLTESEYEKLSWKGRNVQKTFMIEPFASAFWLHFEAYISTRFRTNTSHPFVFQKMDGRPYFTTNRADRIKCFKKIQEAIRIPKDKCLPPHSLRHFYGSYLLN